MKDANYAFAVAKVRACENSLLTRAQLDQMVSAASAKDVINILSSLGWDVDQNTSDYNQMLAQESVKAWNFAAELLDGDKELAVWRVKNDFHNLKVALKSMTVNADPTALYIIPTAVDTAALVQTISDKSFDSLPVYMRDAARDGYDLVTRTLDGQQLDIMLDRAALAATLEIAHESKNDFVADYAELFVALIDIKTAYRAAVTEKSEKFLNTAICGSRELEKELLVSSALNGADSLLAALESTRFTEAAEMIHESFAAFEKWCDDSLMHMLSAAKMKSFGVEPVLAYYAARITEISAVRIILICKQSGAGNDVIAERMRELYV